MVFTQVWRIHQHHPCLQGLAQANRKRRAINPWQKQLTQAAVAISSALSPRPSISPSHRMGHSPSKMIDSRSKCYKQLSDLNNLKLSGVLTDDEYAKEKESVLSMLRKFIFKSVKTSCFLVIHVVLVYAQQL